MIDFIYYAIPWTLGIIAFLSFCVSSFFFGRASAFAEIGRRRIGLVLLALVALYGCDDRPAYGGGGCNLFAHHAYQHHAVVQQVVAYPYAIYQAGADIQADALAEKVSQKVLKLVQQQLVQQQKAAPQSEPVSKPAVSAGTFAKCASCHTGANAAGGVVLDGVTAVECSTYLRWGELAGLGENVPQQMKALMSSMTDAEKGAINSALIRLAKKPKTEGDLE